MFIHVEYGICRPQVFEMLRPGISELQDEVLEFADKGFITVRDVIDRLHLKYPYSFLCLHDETRLLSSTDRVYNARVYTVRRNLDTRI